MMVAKNLLIVGITLLIVYACSRIVQQRTVIKYVAGYNDAVKCYQEWLLEVGYAEYDKRSGEWKLSDANTIQGDLIEPARRIAYTSIEDQIRCMEDELMLLRRQQVLNNKRRTDIKKMPVDFKKL